MAFTQTVSFETVTGETVSYGTQDVNDGGITDNTSVNDDAFQNINSGGMANSTTINTLGEQDVYFGGVASNTSINYGGVQDVASGGTASNTIVNSGAQQDVNSGGTVNNTVINSGGSQVIDGTANNATINSGGNQYILSTVNSTTINAGGHQFVGYFNSMYFAGAAANSTAINSGGYQEVFSGGTASDTLVNSGGSMYVSSGGIASGTLTIAGGHVTIACSDNLQTPAMSFKLATAQANDALLTIQSGAVGDISHTTFTLDVNNTATGTYILGSGADMTGMNNAVFTVKDNGQNVNVKVGASYTFADGDKLSLSLIHTATDQVTAAFTVKGSVVDTLPPTVPTGLKQTVTGSSVLLDWADSTDKSGIKQYDIRVDNNSDFSSPEHTETVTASQAAGDNIPVGTYYWDVRAQDNADNWSAWSKSSSFTITPTDAAGNTWQTATDIANPDNWVGLGDPADVYKLTMTNAGTLTLGLTGLTGNANLSLLSATGAVLKTSSNPGTAPEAINSVALLAGTYYVKVAPGTGVTAAAYTLTNSEKYCPTDTAGNTWQTATDIATPDNWVGFGDAADVYKLTMANAGTLTLGLTGLSGNANLSLLSATGAVLKTSSNPGTAPEAINNAALLAGTYYVKVAAATGVNDASYTLTNTEKYCPTDIAANTWQMAKDISNLDNWVGFGDAADVYKLTMASAGTLTLGLTGLSGNADLSLLSAAGAVLKTSSNPGTAPDSINNVALLAGTYYVKVAAATGVNDASYTLADQISYFPGDTNDKAGNTIATAKLVNALLPPQNGWVGLGDSDDYYRFDLAAAAQGTLRLDMAGGNADLSLYDANGKLLQKSAKTGTLEDMITRNLAAGTYYARINAVSGNSIDYTLTFDKKALAGILAS